MFSRTTSLLSFDSVFQMVAVKFIMMSFLMEVTDEALRSCISDTIRETKQEGPLKRFIYVHNLFTVAHSFQTRNAFLLPSSLLFCN